MFGRGKEKPAQKRWRTLWRGLKREDGAATVEFAILFPAFMALFLSSFELGMYMTRQVMLDRATDLTVRALRLGQFEDPTQELLRFNICRRAAIVSNCSNRLLIELTEVPTTTWETLPDAATCIDRDADIDVVAALEDVDFDRGIPNDLMMIRVCALLEPVFPTTRLALKMPNYNDFYALVTTSAFVIEPGG
ncbi:MAG: TadE family protein [Pseudomonadota bacterium]